MENIITADKADVGMKARKGLRKTQARMMMTPVKTPPKGVLTPDVELTADLPKEAVIAIDPVKEPTNWQKPRAIISCEAAILLVPA